MCERARDKCMLMCGSGAWVHSHLDSNISRLTLLVIPNHLRQPLPSQPRLLSPERGEDPQLVLLVILHVLAVPDEDHVPGHAGAGDVFIGGFGGGKTTVPVHVPEGVGDFGRELLGGGEVVVLGQGGVLGRFTEGWGGGGGVQGGGGEDSAESGAGEVAEHLEEGRRERGQGRARARSARTSSTRSSSTRSSCTMASMTKASSARASSTRTSRTRASSTRATQSKGKQNTGKHVVDKWIRGHGRIVRTTNSPGQLRPVEAPGRQAQWLLSSERRDELVGYSVPVMQGLR